MYQDFFHLTELPFTISPDPHFVYMSSRHQEGLAHLLYGIRQGGGFVSLTGEVGTGKTTLCECLLEQLPEEVNLALVLNPKLDAVDLVATMCDELGIDYQPDMGIKQLVDRLNRFLLDGHAKGRRTVLIIDEAQNLSFDVLEQVRLLTNLETSKHKLLQIILVGQPELQDMLQLPRLRQLNQRITARFHLRPLNEFETEQYIHHRLKRSQGETELFSKACCRRIHQLSNGVPRIINLLCDRAMLGAYVDEEDKVSLPHIHQAALEVDERLLQHCESPRMKILLLLLVASLIGALVYHLPVESPPAGAGYFAEPAELELAEETAVPVEKEAEDRDDIPELKLSQFLAKEKPGLTSAFSALMTLWGVPEIEIQRCKDSRISCLADQGQWQDVLTLNRPVILELQLSDDERYHLLMTGVENGRPVFLHNQDALSFPLFDVLQTWRGLFFLAWQPPEQGVTLVYPGQSSPAILWLRQQFEKNAIYAEGSMSPLFDQKLKAHVVAFQRQHYLEPDGILGPRTFIHLLNMDGSDLPRLRVEN